MCCSESLDMVYLVHVNTHTFFICYVLAFILWGLKAGLSPALDQVSHGFVYLNFENSKYRMDIRQPLPQNSDQKCKHKVQFSVRSPLQLKPSSWLVSYYCSCCCCHFLSCTMWYIYALQYLFPLKYAFGLLPALAGFISHMVQDLSMDFFLFRPTAASPFVDPCYPNYLIFHRIANSNILLMWE